MKRKNLFVAALPVGALLFSMTVVSAAEIPVSYFVRAREFRQGASADSMLMFTLHEDGTCSDVPIATQAVTVADVAVRPRVQNVRVHGDIRDGRRRPDWSPG